MQELLKVRNIFWRKWSIRSCVERNSLSIVETVSAKAMDTNASPRRISFIVAAIVSKHGTFHTSIDLVPKEKRNIVLSVEHWQKNSH